MLQTFRKGRIVKNVNVFGVLVFTQTVLTSGISGLNLFI